MGALSWLPRNNVITPVNSRVMLAPHRQQWNQDLLSPFLFSLVLLMAVQRCNITLQLCMRRPQRLPWVGSSGPSPALLAGSLSLRGHSLFPSRREGKTPAGGFSDIFFCPRLWGRSFACDSLPRKLHSAPEHCIVSHLFAAYCKNTEFLVLVGREVKNFQTSHFLLSSLHCRTFLSLDKNLSLPFQKYQCNFVTS